MNSPAAALWEAYRNKVYNNQDLPPIQERQLSMAFYAGLTKAFDSMDEIIREQGNSKETVDRIRAFREAAAASGLFVTRFVYPPTGED